MKLYYIYILKCSDNSFYTGITNNFENRTDQHNNGSDKKAYTYSRRPVKLVYTEEFGNVYDAIAREKQLKQWSHIKKQSLINRDFEKLEFLSKRKKKQNKLK